MLSLRYKVFDPNNPHSLGAEFKDEEIQFCKEFLNTALKKTKLKVLQSKILLKNRKLGSFLQHASIDTEGHS